MVRGDSQWGSVWHVRTQAVEVPTNADMLSLRIRHHRGRSRERDVRHLLVELEDTSVFAIGCEESRRHQRW